MIDRILNIVSENPKVSDFHLRANCPFSYRLLGEIKILDEEIIKSEDIEALLSKYCSESDVEIFNSKSELDSGFMVENVRFRANFYRTLKGPDHASSIEPIGMKDIVTRSKKIFTALGNPNKTVLESELKNRKKFRGY